MHSYRTALLVVFFALASLLCLSAQQTTPPNQRPRDDRIRIAPHIAESLTRKVVLPKDIGIPGEVTLEVEVGKDGRVLNVRGVSGDSRLIRAAKPSLMNWIIAPFFLNGEPVKYVTNLTIQFDGKSRTAKLKLHADPLAQ